MQSDKSKDEDMEDETPSQMKKSQFWKKIKIESEKERELSKKNKLLNFPNKR